MIAIWTVSSLALMNNAIMNICIQSCMDMRFNFSWISRSGIVGVYGKLMSNF